MPACRIGEPRLRFTTAQWPFKVRLTSVPAEAMVKRFVHLRDNIPTTLVGNKIFGDKYPELTHKPANE